MQAGTRSGRHASIWTHGALRPHAFLRKRRIVSVCSRLIAHCAPLAEQAQQPIFSTSWQSSSAVHASTAGGNSALCFLRTPSSGGRSPAQMHAPDSETARKKASVYRSASRMPLLAAMTALLRERRCEMPPRGTDGVDAGQPEQGGAPIPSHECGADRGTMRPVGSKKDAHRGVGRGARKLPLQSPQLEVREEIADVDLGVP